MSPIYIHAADLNISICLSKTPLSRLTHPDKQDQCLDDHPLTIHATRIPGYVTNHNDLPFLYFSLSVLLDKQRCFDTDEVARS